MTQACSPRMPIMGICPISDIIDPRLPDDSLPILSGAFCRFAQATAPNNRSKAANAVKANRMVSPSEDKWPGPAVW